MATEGAGAPSGAGLLLSLIAAGEARSRAELVTTTGLSRTTVTQHLAQLLAGGLIEEGDERRRSGGRPARLLALAPGAALVLAADIGETHARLAVTDLTPAVLAACTIPIDLGAGPIPVLALLAARFRSLLAELGQENERVLGVGLGLPAPVDHTGGRVVGPSVMPGWDDFDICDCLGAHLGAPVLVENDVNLLALAERAGSWSDTEQLLFVKAGTGIGSGIIADGRLYRGAQGASGDIGHIQIGAPDGPLCRCDKRSCLEAHAGGWAIARDLRAQGFAAETARDVVALLKAGEPAAEAALRRAGRVLGEVIASTVSILNPSAIVIGGTLAEAGETLLSGIRAEIHARSLPLAIRHLRILRAETGREAGLLGAARLVIADRLSPRHADATIAAHARPAAALAATAPKRLHIV
ncbi:MAG TPA: ROK family transcriptional regulator [Acidisoma sp.]|uniref:ROK family transcriptional regulator n=1 Tax=Acidisoma sp. TaxID=1872115 RepID=UPI002BE259FB|nr:ROK family transcriptional regulator [Acidisoma sp.]HTH99742.1 ROK family transcriptional regulator [Acidisoma sp.]